MFSSANLLSAPYQAHLADYETALVSTELSRHTRRNYLTQARQFLLFAQKLGFSSDLLMNNADQRDQAIELYRNELLKTKARSGSINTVLATIKHFYRLKGADIPKAPREPNVKIDRRFLKADELARVLGVLNEIGNKDRAIVILFLLGGIRLKECVDLNVGDVSEVENGFDITVFTGGEPRSIVLAGEAAIHFSGWWEERKRYFHASEALFINRMGERITPSGFDSIIRKSGLKARVVISARVLRNTWAKGQKLTDTDLTESQLACEELDFG